LEVEVTNLAAKAGKGEVVGSLSFPVGHGESTLRKVASVRMLHQSSDAENISSYTLQRKVSCFSFILGCVNVYLKIL
jgi:vacuolar protein sorting-associated protein 13A/C